MKLELLLKFAGALQLSLLVAGAAMQHVTGMRTETSRFSPFHRQLFWVYLVFIGFTLAGFGVVTLLNAESLAAGTPLARTVCGFIALFWLLRLLVQALVLDVRPYLKNGWLKLGYHSLTAVFIYRPVVHGWAAWGRGLR
jgi:hypothetical protein